MHKIAQLIIRSKNLFINDSLFRNSVFLILSTAIMSVLGFGFWLFVAHLYSPEQIGAASALIAVTTLLGNISLLGLEASLVRFLPRSKNQSRDINAAIAIVSGASVLAAIAYLAVSPLLGVHIDLLDNAWEKIGFIVLMIVVSLNSLTDAVFIANRRAELHTATYTILATVKLILPLLLIPFGSMGIFTAYAAAMFCSLFLTFVLMRRSVAYRVHSTPNWNLLRQTRRYAANNYIGHILSSMTSQVMPLLILTRLGTSEVAYFSMAWTMANFLYVIPTAIAQSLLAESAGTPAAKRAHLRGAVKLLALILLPVVILSMAAAPTLLQVFGEKYSVGSTGVFQVLALATFFVAINEVCNTILNIEHRSSGVVASQLSALLTTFLSTLFLLQFGLVGVGTALLLGTIASNVCHLIYFSFGLGKKRTIPSGSSETEDLSGQLTMAIQAGLKDMLVPYGIDNFTFESLTNGSSTHSFLIRYGEKDAKVVRVYGKKSKTRKQVQQEVDFMRYLNARGVPVPRIIPNSYDQYVTTHSISGHPRHYVLMDFEAGTHPEEYTPALIEQMATQQAAIHIHGATFAKTQRHHMRLTPKSDILLRLAPTGYSHCDYDATNVLAEKDKLTCVLDFEGMRYVPLVSCLFFTLSRIYEMQKQLDAGVRQYLNAYQKVRRLNVLERFIIRAAMAKHCRQPRLLFAEL